MLALLPILALAATGAIARPIEGAYDDLPQVSGSESAQPSTTADSCGRWKGQHGNHTRWGGRPSRTASFTAVFPTGDASATVSASAEVPSGTDSYSAEEPTVTDSAAEPTETDSATEPTVTESATAEEPSLTDTIISLTDQNAIVTGQPTSAITDVASASDPAPTGSTGDAATGSDQEKYLKLHNDFRAQYGAGPLKWADDLAARAKAVSSTCKFEHQDTNGVGQNLAASTGSGDAITSGIEGWANEAGQYDWNNPGFSSGTGHFTQMVWKATTEVGCAVVVCPAGSIFDASYGTSQYVTCDYRVAGNMVGSNNQYFIENVGQKV